MPTQFSLSRCSTIPLHKKQTQYFSIKRVIYMDGCDLPVIAENTNQGHSIGHFHGNVLVVDTALLTDRWMDQLDGIPLGAEKRVVERNFLSPDRIQLISEYFGEDREYLTTPTAGVFSCKYAVDCVLIPFEWKLKNASFIMEQ